MAHQRLAQTPLKVVIKMACRTCLVHVFIQMVQCRMDLGMECVAQVGGVSYTLYRQDLTVYTCIYRQGLFIISPELIMGIRRPFSVGLQHFQTNFLCVTSKFHLKLIVSRRYRLLAFLFIEGAESCDRDFFSGEINTSKFNTSNGINN